MLVGKGADRRSIHHSPFTIHRPASQHSCLLPTWWFWRGGCTRSHSEHGRETPQRRWYFVSRRGRVGRCQVCQMHECQSSLNDNPPKGGAKGRERGPSHSRTRTNPGQPPDIGDAGWSSAPSDRRKQNFRGRTNQAPSDPRRQSLRGRTTRKVRAARPADADMVTRGGAAR
jgi:hypothetical protein